MIAILSGGVGAAKFARGLAHLDSHYDCSIISNVADDDIFHGLHVSPDIDTMIYTLAGAINSETGWGLAGESWRVMESLSDYGADTWFRLGDRDLATHLFRTQLLNTGVTLSEVTDKMRIRWGVKPQILPVTDAKIATTLYCEIEGDKRNLSFQEYFVQHAQRPKVISVSYVYQEDIEPTAQVISVLESADTIVIAPSNPILSIGPILAVPRVKDILQGRREKVAAISPIVAGKAIKGPAAKLMHELGLEPTALGVARYYREIAASMVIDTLDAHLEPEIANLGLATLVTNTMMTSDEISSALMRSVLEMIAG